MLTAKNTDAAAASKIAFFCDAQLPLPGRYTSTRLPAVTSSMAMSPVHDRCSPVITGDRASRNSGDMEKIVATTEMSPWAKAYIFSPSANVSVTARRMTNVMNVAANSNRAWPRPYSRASATR